MVMCKTINMLATCHVRGGGGQDPIKFTAA